MSHNALFGFSFDLFGLLFVYHVVCLCILMVLLFYVCVRLFVFLMLFVVVVVLNIDLFVLFACLLYKEKEREGIEFEEYRVIEVL